MAEARIIDGKAVCTPVERGPSDLTHSILLKGVEPGEQIIVGPYKVLESIKHDQLVRLQDETTDLDEQAADETGDEESVEQAGTG